MAPQGQKNSDLNDPGKMRRPLDSQDCASMAGPSNAKEEQARVACTHENETQGMLSKLNFVMQMLEKTHFFQFPLSQLSKTPSKLISRQLKLEDLTNQLQLQLLVPITQRYKSWWAYLQSQEGC